MGIYRAWSSVGCPASMSYSYMAVYFFREYGFKVYNFTY